MHNSTNWNGCVMDRGDWDDPDGTYNYDTNAERAGPGHTQVVVALRGRAV